jgi:putative flippase GtrA
MQKVWKDLYGSGVLFFYFMKWIIFLGLPILYFVLDFKPNIILDFLWIYSFALITKDFIIRFILKKKYCDCDVSKKR